MACRGIVLPVSPGAENSLKQLTGLTEHCNAWLQSYHKGHRYTPGPLWGHAWLFWGPWSTWASRELTPGHNEDKGLGNDLVSLPRGEYRPSDYYTRSYFERVGSSPGLMTSVLSSMHEVTEALLSSGFAGSQFPSWAGMG